MLTAYQHNAMLQQILVTMAVIKAFDENQEYRWVEGAFVPTKNFRVETIRLGLELTQERFAERFEMPIDVVQGFEQLPRFPEGTGVLFLRHLAERAGRR